MVPFHPDSPLTRRLRKLPQHGASLAVLAVHRGSRNASAGRRAYVQQLRSNVSFVIVDGAYEREALFSLCILPQHLNDVAVGNAVPAINPHAVVLGVVSAPPQNGGRLAVA